MASLWRFAYEYARAVNDFSDAEDYQYPPIDDPLDPHWGGQPIILSMSCGSWKEPAPDE